MHARIALFLLVLGSLLGATALGCGTARSGHTDDAGGGGGDDAFVDPAVDAWVDPGGDDAWVDPGIDAGDPLNAAPTCTSGRMWRFGDLGSQQMNPGRACIQCHDTEPRAPSFSAAGTVYPTGHEPDLCNGTGGAAVTIELHDSVGNTATVSPNSVGNFFYEGALTPPITASIHYMGRTREMVTPADTGDCNSCHTQDGTMDAPGRITLP